jgi:hypothetical protein
MEVTTDEERETIIGRSAYRQDLYYPQRPRDVIYQPSHATCLWHGSMLAHNVEMLG